MEPRPLDPDLRRIFDEAIERAPRLRQRSLVDYVRRHYGCKVSRRTAAAYLKERGLVERSTVEVAKPMRRFEAPEPLDLLQVDLVYVPKIGGGWLFSVNILDDFRRFIVGLVEPGRPGGGLSIAQLADASQIPLGSLKSWSGIRPRMSLRSHP